MKNEKLEETIARISAALDAEKRPHIRQRQRMILRDLIERFNNMEV